MMDVSILDGGTHLTLTNGEVKHRFHAIWLRDNASDRKPVRPGMASA
jgi:gamma-butyrobetaine dioxygenase